MFVDDLQIKNRLYRQEPPVMGHTSAALLTMSRMIQPEEQEQYRNLQWNAKNPRLAYMTCDDVRRKAELAKRKASTPRTMAEALKLRR